MKENITLLICMIIFVIPFVVEAWHWYKDKPLTLWALIGHMECFNSVDALVIDQYGEEQILYDDPHKHIKYLKEMYGKRIVKSFKVIRVHDYYCLYVFIGGDWFVF